MNTQVFVCGTYRKDVVGGGDACVCESALTYSIEDLKFLLCLEDIDLQKKKKRDVRLSGVLIMVLMISTTIHHV